MRTVFILSFQIIFFCLFSTDSAAETIYGQGVVGTYYTWDISLGAHGDEGEFRIELFDKNDLYPVNGAVMYTLCCVNFHDVKTASSDSTAYVDACLAHTNKNYVHVFRTVEGNYAKVRIDLYAFYGGEDYNIEWVYQTDGSTNLDHLLGVEESTWGAIKELFKSE